MHRKRQQCAAAFIVLFVLAISAPFSSTQGQEIPPEQLAQGLRPLSEVQVLQAPGVNVAERRAEDIERQPRPRDIPLRFATPFPVTVTPADSGIWEELRDGETSVWRLRIASEGARSLNLGFTRYAMPSGGRLFLYTPDYEQIIGPFTDADNESHGELWTPILVGSEVVIEVSVPAGRVEELGLEIGAINAGHRDFAPGEKQGACNIDVICKEGNEFRDVIRSVGMISVAGTDLCSGSMVNNTSGDGKPYVLTAQHCGINVANAARVVVYWNYESATCGALSGGSLRDFQSGAYFRAGWERTDFTLLELDDPVNPAHDVYWAGWNRSAGEATSVVGVHHPGTDEKAISLSYQPTTTTSWLGDSVPGDGSHIRVLDWDVGTTEGGSSGSPLFDQDKRVIGQLTGGHAACGNDLLDWYGRLSASWTGGGTPTTRLRDWLDPLSTGRVTIDGQ